MIKIKIPATSANIGSGFDSLGIALTMYNEVMLEESDEISIESLDDVKVPTDENNLVYWSAKRLYEECGKKIQGLKIKQINNIPMARGLGSSSACIVAGLLGANRFLGSPLSKNELINLASKIEGHPDNTTPAITGGLVTSAIEGERVYSVTVPVAKNIRFAVMIPPFELKTDLARSVLPQSYSKDDVVYNLSRAALMTASLFSGSLDNLRVAVSDKLHQPYRAKFIHGFENIFRLSYELGSYGTYISGAGPSIISIVDENSSENFKKYALSRFKDKNEGDWKLLMLESDSIGATISIE